jgi:elongation factor Ts
MANISAAEVNKLRKHTGAGMMDCKKALVEAEGDFDKAIEVLRKKGQKVAEKRSDREAHEGVILAGTTDGEKFGAMITLNCETDFVAKNEDFVSTAKRILEVALNDRVTSLENLKEKKFNDELNISEKITEEVGKIGEKIELSEYATIEAEKVVAYNHPGNKTAALVGLNQATADAEQAGKNVAMQIAAMNPVALDADSVSEEIKEREMEIGREKARKEGKPEQIIEKIAEGNLHKYYKENTLLNQQYFVDNKQNVKGYLQSVDKELQVTDFKRSSLV